MRRSQAECHACLVSPLVCGICSSSGVPLPTGSSIITRTVAWAAAAGAAAAAAAAAAWAAATTTTLYPQSINWAATEIRVSPDRRWKRLLEEHPAQTEYLLLSAWLCGRQPSLRLPYACMGSSSIRGSSSSSSSSIRMIKKKCSSSSSKCLKKAPRLDATAT